MLDWAQRNLEELGRDDAAFHRKRPYHLTGNYELHGTEIQAVVRIAVADFLRPVPDVALRIGDILHNMRVALDYLAFAIAQRHAPEIANDERTAKNIYFPIVLDSAKWPTKRNEVARWAGPAIDYFEFAQPFNHHFSGALHPLYLLHELDRPHKHRNLLAAAPSITGIDYQRLNEHAELEPIAFGLEGPFQTGTVIARYKYVGPPGQGPTKGSLATTAVFEVAFEKSGPALGHAALPLLSEIGTYLRAAVFPLLERHLT